jgi:hypothetical protein
MQEMLGKLSCRRVRGLTIRAHGDRRVLGPFAERICNVYSERVKYGEGKGTCLRAGWESVDPKDL